MNPKAIFVKIEKSNVTVRLLLSPPRVFSHSSLKGSCLSSREENFPQLFFLKILFLKYFFSSPISADFFRDFDAKKKYVPLKTAFAPDIVLCAG